MRWDVQTGTWRWGQYPDRMLAGSTLIRLCLKMSFLRLDGSRAERNWCGKLVRWLWLRSISLKWTLVLERTSPASNLTRWLLDRFSVAAMNGLVQLATASQLNVFRRFDCSSIFSRLGNQRKAFGSSRSRRLWARFSVINLGRWSKAEWWTTCNQTFSFQLQGSPKRWP